MHESIDEFALAQVEDIRVAVGVCITTAICREPQRAHGLLPTSAIALGRLLTAAILTNQLGQQSEALSLQIIGQGRLGQLFADVSRDGRVRGYVKKHDVNLPVLPNEDPECRRIIAPAVGAGSLSAIRFAHTSDFVQSTTPLVSGEVDEDVAAYLNDSDQVPTTLSCDVLLDPAGGVETAGGVILQAMPDTRQGKFEALRQQIQQPAFCQALRSAAGNIRSLLNAVLPEATVVGQPIALRWECRCSYERVVSALKLLDPQDLAEMVDRAESPEVTCDFCAKHYRVSPEDVEQAFLNTVTGRA